MCLAAHIDKIYGTAGDEHGGASVQKAKATEVPTALPLLGNIDQVDDTILDRVRTVIKAKGKLMPPPPTLLTHVRADQELWAGDGLKYTPGKFKMPPAAVFVGALHLRPSPDTTQGLLYWVADSSTLLLHVAQVGNMARLEHELWSRRGSCDNGAEFDARFERGKPWDPHAQRLEGLAKLPACLLGLEPYYLERRGPAAFLGLSPPYMESQIRGPLAHIPERSLLSFVGDGRPVRLQAIFQSGCVEDFHWPSSINTLVDIQLHKETLLYTLAHIVARTAVNDSCEIQTAGTNPTQVGSKHTINTPNLAAPQPLHSHGIRNAAWPAVTCDLRSDIYMDTYGCCSHRASLGMGGVTAVQSTVLELFEESDATLLNRVLKEHFRGDAPDIGAMLEFVGTKLEADYGLCVVEMSQLVGCIASLRLETLKRVRTVNMDAVQRLVCMPKVSIVIVDTKALQSLHVEVPYGFPKLKLKLDADWRNEVVAKLDNHSLMKVEAARELQLRDADVQQIVLGLKSHVGSIVSEMIRSHIDSTEITDRDDPGRMDRRQHRKRKSDEVLASFALSLKRASATPASI